MEPNKNWSDFEERLINFKKKQHDIDENARKFRETINKDYAMLDQQLGKLKAQEKELRELKETVHYQDFGNTSKQQVHNIQKEIADLGKSIKNLRSALTPRTGSLFVRLFLGKVNVKNYREGERFKLKQEYQKFKRRTDPLFLLFCCVQLFILPGVRATEVLFQIWLLYYYVTLALRENILKVNGSNIKEWWIIHHYLSIGVSLSMLTWPDSAMYRYFLPQFLYLCLAQGVVQFLQNRYQTHKLYKLIAMGKASTMDVTGEGLLGDGVTAPRSPNHNRGSFSSSPPQTIWNFIASCAPTMTVLLPFLIFVQLFQLYNGYTVLKAVFEQSIYNVEWQMATSGALFVALGFGNLLTTINVYREKYKQN